MKMKRISALVALLALAGSTGCDKSSAGADGEAEAAQVGEEAEATAVEEAPKTEPVEEAKPAEPEPLEGEGYDKLADGVTCEFGSFEQETAVLSCQNTGQHDIKYLSYFAFAYGKDDKLIEVVEGKRQSKLAAQAKSEFKVGPFTKASKAEGVTMELIVKWMNVDGTSWQRPVPKDRAKGGLNDLTKAGK